MTEDARPCAAQEDAGDYLNTSVDRYASALRTRTTLAPGDPLELAEWLVESCSSKRNGHKDALDAQDANSGDDDGEGDVQGKCSRVASPDRLGGGDDDDDDGEDLDEENADEADATARPPRARTQTESTVEEDLAAVAQALELAKAAVEQLQLKMVLKANEQMDVQAQREIQTRDGGKRYSSGEIERPFLRAGVPVVGARPVTSATSCAKCSRYFSAFQRGRNCITCGHLFCAKCVSRQQVVPSKFGHGDAAVRVCDPCSDWLQRAMDRYFDAVDLVQRGHSEQDERKRRDHELLALRVRARSRSDRVHRHSMVATDSRSKQWFSGNLRAMHVSDRPLRRRSTNAIDVNGILPYNENGDEEDIDRDNSENADGSAESQRAPISTFTRPPSISIDTSRPGNRRRLESSDGEDANEEGDDESATPLEDLSQLDLEIKSPVSPSIPEDLINVTVSRTRSVSKPVELESKKNAPRKTKYSRSASIDFASLSTICTQPSLPLSPAASDASESVASIGRGSVASSGDLRASFSSSKKYFDDSDIVDHRRSFVGSSDAGGGVDSDATSDSQHAIEQRGVDFLPATVLRFAVYDVGSKESHSLKRSIVRFGRKNVLVDRYTVEVDRAQGVVRVKSVFMHRYWSFRCDAVYSVMAVAGGGSGAGGGGGGGGAVARVVVVAHDGHGGHQSLEWEFGSEADRDQFKAVVDELKSRKVSPISTRSSRARRRDGEATTDGASATLEGPTSSSSDEAVPSSGLHQHGAPRVRSLFQLLPGEVTITQADIPVTLLIGPAADSSTSVGEIAVWGRMRGFVFVTNYRVMFVHTTEQCQSLHRSPAVAYIPLFAVTSSQVVFAGGRRPRSTRAFQSTAPPVVVVSCKDAREMRLEIEGSVQVVDDLAQNLLATINRLADAAQRYRQVKSVVQSPAPSSPSTMTLEGLEIGDRVQGTLSEQYARDLLPSSGNDHGGMNGSPRSQATTDSLLSPALIPISGGVTTTSPTVPSSDRSDAFAFFYSIGSIPDDVNGWKLYTDEREFRRQIVADPIAQPFLKFYQNTRGNVCKSYPAKLLVPSSMTSSTLMKVAEFRAKNRLPVVTYYHQRNRCVLVRSGQPLLGNLLSGSSSLSDQLLLGVYRRFPEIIRTQSQSAPSSRPIYVFDARKLKASTGNRLMGKGGVETPQDYPGAVIHHLDIANMYRMQSSYQALLKLVVPGGVDDQDKAWLSSLEATRWLSHVRQVLEGAVKIARVLELEGSSVLVHCSDGWDRTAQLTALAQIMIDPYFRTIRGFAVVVEKDWCAFGHKFAERLGGDRAKDPQRSKSSPVMFQFLDAVWQMLRQFPTAFEFDERFLLHIANSLTSGLYGTFLYDSRFDRDANDVKNTTVSVWTPVLMAPEAFRNPEYSPMDSPLWPWTSTQMVRLWEAYFFQWHSKYFGCRWTASLVHHHHHHDHHTTNPSGHNGTKGELRTAMANNRSVSLDETRSSGSPAATGPLTPASTTSSSVVRDRQGSGEFGTIMGGAARSLRHQQHADKKSPPMHKIFLFKS